MLRAAYRVSLWLRRLVLAALLLGVVAFGPALWVEATCITPGGGARIADAAPPVAASLPGGFARLHVQSAREDYARVLAAGDPHDYDVIPAVAGFWRTLCPLARKASAAGTFDGAARREVYTLGARFTAGTLLRGAYEETAGRLMAMLRGPGRSALDDLAAAQAAQRAAFLRDLPWHQYGYAEDAAALLHAAGGTPRDWERAIALGIGYRAEAALAWAVRRALPGDGIEPLTLRMVVSGAAPQDLAGIGGVTVIGPAPAGIEIELPRLHGLAEALSALAAAGADFTGIGGSDEVLIALDGPAALPGALHAYRRQGSGTFRSLIVARVSGLAARLREAAGSGVALAAVAGH
jgi:hypothetical protein